MNWSPLLTVAAGVVALAVSVLRRVSALLLESSVEISTPETLVTVVQSGRFVSFVLVYGVLFGLAFWVGRRRESGLTAVALVSGVAAAVGYLVGSGAMLLIVDVQQGPLVSATLALGGGLGVGTELAVVTFAGLALATHRTAASD